MGNTFACCGKSDVDPNNLDTSRFQNYQGPSKLRAIIKVQAVFRGFLARKRVKALKE